MSKILKSTTLGNVKNGGIFKALGKKFVKLDADEHGCLVLAKDIWTKMPFRDGDDPECPNDLRRSDVMKYLSNCLAEFTEKGTPLDTFIPFKIDLQDTTGQTEYGTVEYRIGLLTLRQYGKYWRLIPKVECDTKSRNVLCINTALSIWSNPTVTCTGQKPALGSSQDNMGNLPA